MVIDRRKHKRFLVKGAVEMKTPAGNFRGELVSISGGGFLIFADMAVPVGTEIGFSYDIEGYPGKIEGKGMVVRTDKGVVAVTHPEEQAEGITELLSWLEMAFVFGAF